MKDWPGRLMATLIGCIVSLLILVASLGAAPTVEEVSKQISLESPYVQDRSLILYRLEQIEKKQDEILERLVPAPK